MKSYRSHIRETFRLAIPVAVGQLGQIMFGVVDSLMVGRLGAAPLAASALVNGLFFLIMVMGIGISMAVTPLVAIAKGGRNHDECGVILRQSLLVNVVFAFLLNIIIYLMAETIPYLGQTPEVTKLAVSYMHILSFSVLPFMLFQTYRQFVEGLSDTKPPMYAALTANIVNAIANYVLIFGKLGFPAMGLDGAGIATVTTRSFMALFLIYFVIKKDKYKEYDPSLKFKKIDKTIIKKIISIGLPSGFQYTFEVGAFAFAAVMVGWISADAQASHQIAINLASISYMVVLGISSAGTIRVGDNLGKNDKIGMRRAGFSALLLAVLFMSSTGLLFILFRHFLPTLYIDDQTVIQLASRLLLITAIFQIADGIQAVGLGILRGLTDVKIPLYIAIFAYWVVSLPTAYLCGFTFQMGVTGIWIGLSAGLFTAAILLASRFYLKTK